MTGHPPRDESREFTYNAQATEARMGFVGLAIVVTLEGAAGITVLLFLTEGLARVLGVGIALALYVLGLALLCSPLFTKHSVTAGGLTLHLGLGFKAVIPREEIALVGGVDIKLPGIPGRVAYHRAQDLLVASMSRRGLILMQLVRPRTFRRWPFLNCETARVLFNVDEPDLLLEALAEGVPAMAGSPEAEGAIPVASELRAEGINNTAIRTEGLTKFYGEQVGVENLDLSVLWGEIYGLLGVNGAGKTTTLKMLVGLMQPTKGHVEICGLSVHEEPTRAKACLGYLAETTIVYEKLTGREFLEFMAELREMDQAAAADRIQELLVALDLTEWADQMIRVYSFGMRRKIALAGAVLHHPAVLILDEPFNGLDPRSSRRVRNYLRQARERGMTILVSTHNLAIAEEICDRIGIVDRGHLIAEGTAAELRQQAQLEGSTLEDVFLRLTAEAEDPTVAFGT